MKKFLILICLLTGFSAATSVSIYTADAAVRITQKQRVCFTLLDERGEPIPFANVQVKGTNRGVTTDWDGSACIDVYPGETLVISAIGYESIEVVYSGQPLGKVTLREE